MNTSPGICPKEYEKLKTLLLRVHAIMRIGGCVKYNSPLGNDIKDAVMGGDNEIRQSDVGG